MKKILTVFVLIFVGIFSYAEEIRWDYDDLKEVSDYLVSACRESERIENFKKEHKRTPTVILGEIRVKSDEEIDTSQLAKRLQDSLINSGVFDFASDSFERIALRTEKQDQDYHASESTAKTIDNETAADFMLQGNVYLVKHEKKTIFYSVTVQFHDIERNKIIFSKEFLVKAIAQNTKSNWLRYHAFSFAVPISNRSFEADEGDADCDFNSTGFGFDYSTHTVHKKNNFTVLAGLGAAFGNGELTAEYEYSGNAELDDISVFTAYAKAGIGRAFSSLSSSLIFIPTFGTGLFFDCMNAEYKSKDFTGCDVSIDLFFNFFLAFMFTEHFGICAAFEISTDAWGAGYFEELENYTFDSFGAISFMPTLGICFRF